MSIFTKIKKRLEPADMDNVREGVRHNLADMLEDLQDLKAADPQPTDTCWTNDAGEVVTWTPAMLAELDQEIAYLIALRDGIQN